MCDDSLPPPAPSADLEPPAETSASALRGATVPADATVPQVAQAPVAVSIEAAVGHHFADPSLLELALTHPSWANVEAQRQAAQAARGGRGSSAKKPVASDNQRLEFLGDAVVDLLVSERLFLADRAAREGLLTERRAALVHEARLADAARAMGLGAHLRLGPGEERAGFRERPGVLADAFEAVAAAVWLDGGPDAARAFIERVFAEDFARVHPERLKPAKARLQELTQARWKLTPTYSVLSAPPATETFEVEVRVGELLATTGVGKSRRAAEDHAAVDALARLAVHRRGG